MTIEPAPTEPKRPLCEAVTLTSRKLLNPGILATGSGITSEAPVLVILAAGKGTRFGQNPKCIQPVQARPLARYSIDSFRRMSAAPAVCLVGYRYEEVMTALGPDNVYVRSDNPTGGTAYAVYEAFCVPDLLDKDPLLIITMGDRIVPPSIFRRLWEAYRGPDCAAALAFLSAQYEPPRNHGKGRVLRDENGCVLRIVEERDIAAEKDDLARHALFNLTEGNCPLYAIRAKLLYRCLQSLTNANAQGQYYLTDVIEAVTREGGEIRTVTTTVSDPEYDLLCCDVTQPMDLALLEGKLETAHEFLAEINEIEQAARMIAAGRPPGQVAAIAGQLAELVAANTQEKLGYRPDWPVGIGAAGGRLRIAFMHPDMGRFFGPAWQMPIGAADPDGREQVVMLAQEAEDHRVHLYPLDPRYRESLNSVPSDSETMYPGEEISDWHTYEGFGTRMSETLLLSLGYFSDAELQERRRQGLPLPPASLRVSSNMRRPFALIGNAIASLRTLRRGNLGARVQEHLGRHNFQGLRLLCSGSIPQGGFSSSSAVIVSSKNAINALYDLGIPADMLVHLAAQAEYGTGVRAGSLDQATEQKGKAGQGTLISSNPRENYRIIATYPVPTDRFHVIFPYSVERDRDAWRWSWGCYAESAGHDPGPLTTGEMRKMTGKAAEIAAILTQLPLEVDYFSRLQDDLVDDGLLGDENRNWICSILRQVPLLIGLDELKQRVTLRQDWYLDQLMDVNRLDRPAAGHKAKTTFEALFTGWREPILRRTIVTGETVRERGVPLRAMLAYLFGEVAKNFYLIHHSAQWIEYVTRSQHGDCCVEIDLERLPVRQEMEQPLAWERGLTGPDRLHAWLDRCGARLFDFNRGLDDPSLQNSPPLEFHRLEGSNFFRGLALIDLAQAMLKRAFGPEAVAVRVNAAGQGDYFQVHIDKLKVEVEDVKCFLRTAFYRRFDLAPDPEFVTLHPGGGAVGIRLSSFAVVPQLIQRLRMPDLAGLR